MLIFCPVDDAERVALVERRFDGPELYAQERIAWDDTGADEDALWVVAEVDDAILLGYEDPDGPALGYRPFTLPGDFVNSLRWRAVPEAEVDAARRAEAVDLQDRRDRAREEALRNGRRLGLG